MQCDGPSTRNRLFISCKDFLESDHSFIIFQRLIISWKKNPWYPNFLCDGKLFVIQSLGLTSVTHPVSTLSRKRACEKKRSSIYILESQYDL
ncbi:unnamed protein product, partial [Musa textilis]